MGGFSFLVGFDLRYCGVEDFEVLKGLLSTCLWLYVRSIFVNGEGMSEMLSRFVPKGGRFCW